MSVTDAPTTSLLHGMAMLAQSEHLTVGRDGFNPHFQYAYMTEEALFAAAREALAEVGMSGTISFDAGQHEIITTFTREGEQRPAIMATVTAVLTIRDAIGNSLECRAFGQGIDPADKAYAKAMTMAAKYVVQKALMIAVESGDDTDAGQGSQVARRGGNGDGAGTASEKQLGFLAAMTKRVLKTEHGETEPMALRLARMQGDSAVVFAAISKRTASDLIDKLQKVEANPEAGTVILERLAAWEAENPQPTDEAAGQPDVPVEHDPNDPKYQEQPGDVPFG